MSNEYSLKKIGELVKYKKIKASHDMIVYLFQLWLERHGVSIKKMKILEEFKGLAPDIIVFKDNSNISVIWEIIEPDPEWDISIESIKTKLERMLIRPYIHVYKPKIVVLTNGTRMIIYDSKGNQIKEVTDLSLIDSEKEKEIEEILLTY